MIAPQITMKMKGSCRFRSLKLVSGCFQEGEKTVTKTVCSPGTGATSQGVLEPMGARAGHGQCSGEGGWSSPTANCAADLPPSPAVPRHRHGQMDGALPPHWDPGDHGQAELGWPVRSIQWPSPAIPVLPPPRLSRQVGMGKGEDWAPRGAETDGWVAGGQSFQTKNYS